MKISLVLEGGGMRGTYSTGVLDFLLDEQVEFCSCYAVSAGSGHACSFLSRQRGRAFRVVANNVKIPEYAGVKVLLKTGDFFNVDYIYHKIPDKLDIYDYDAFANNPTKFFAVCTNLETGKADYLQVEDLRKDMGKIVASSSLPFLSRTQVIEGKPYLDGGIGDSIPVRKALETADKAVVVLTRDLHYRKSPFKLKRLLKFKYGKYPEFCKAMLDRYERYNETLDFIAEAEKEGKLFVFRPTYELQVGRLERDPAKLKALYEQGFEESLKRKQEFEEFVK